MSLLIGLTTPLYAQSVANSSPLPWQTELTESHSKIRDRTLRLARQNGWPLSKNYSNQRVLQLQEVDALGEPVYYTLHNVEAARGTQTQALYGTGTLPVSLSGNSAQINGRLGLWDGGRVLSTHQEFAGTTTGTSRIQQKDNGTTINDHTTHLAGTLIGKGVNTLAKGMSFGAQLSVWDYTNDITELTTAATSLLVSNHSYGPVAGWVYNDYRPGSNPDLKWEWWGNTAISETEDYLFGFYTANARDLDRIAYNNPFFLMVRSADNKRAETGPPTGKPYFLKSTSIQSTLPRSRNDTYDVIPAEATAKNVLTVGAATVSFTSANKVVLQGTTSFSGWGPTDDGRIKPDLLGVGTDIFSSLSATDTTYGTYTGTSMASANVAGSLFLLQELYARQRAPGLPTSGQFMRAATLKGLAIHTASRPAPAAGPDYRQGWGLLNTEAAARLLLNEDQASLVLEKNLIAGGSYTQSITAQGSEPLLITLSWTDPEGAATTVAASSLNSRTPKLVNDLDIRLVSGQKTEFPFVLNPDKPAEAATKGDNVRDNVEQIYIANPIAGQTYTLTVSHKGKLTYSSQPFSVIISGLKHTACQLTTSIQPARDTTICNGTPFILQSSNKSTSLRYQWLRDGVTIANASTSAHSITNTGSYLVQITDSNGCVSTSQPVYVTVKTSAAPLTPSSDQWLCSTQSTVALQTATNSVDATIAWLRDGEILSQEQSATLQVNQPGHYQVRITQNGCEALSTEINVRSSSVNNLDIAPKETELFLPQGATVTLKAPVDTSYRYQWYRNEQALPNARDYRFVVTQAGSYKVQVKQQTCAAWSTERVILTTILTATNTDPAAQFILFPNPSEHMLSVRYTNLLARQATLSLYDSRGVLQQMPILLKAQNGLFEADISVQHLPSGSYILNLRDGFTTQVKRFLKK
ncbi:S8 family serine peptidase [Spirosoma aerophilum]